MSRSGLSQREQELVGSVDSRRLMAHNRVIARETRLSGSREELEAFHYIQSVLDGYGFQTQLQQIEALISLPVRAALNVVGLGEIECITHSMGASVDRLEGEVIYCQAGAPADYQSGDARGKIALVDGMAMPLKVQTGEAAGAIAQIHISGDELHEMCISPVWGSPTPQSAAHLPHTPSISIRTRDAERIKTRLQHGPVRAEMSTVVDTGYRSIPLLVADLPGGEDPESFVLFSAHVDSWYLGAMDNGSANAAQLEVAQLLAQSAPHRRSLRIAFWSGHSHGRYAGSAWYADHHWEELFDGCVAHVNIDSVGGMGANDLIHDCAVQELRPLARAVVAEIAGQDYVGSRVGRAGDESFMGIGVPAIFMDFAAQPAPQTETPTAQGFAKLSGSSDTGGLGWWWHTPEDTLDKIDPENLARDTRVYLITLDRLLNAPLLPMDFRPAVSEIQGLIQGCQAKVEDRFDLGPALERARQLQQAVDQFYDRVETLQENGRSLPYERLNRSLMRLSRVLTALNYTEAGAFDQDPAYNQPPLPLLRNIDDLAGLAPGSDRYRQTITLLVRRRNALCQALREAIDRAQALLALLPEQSS